MKIYCVKYGQSPLNQLLTASERAMQLAVNYYREQNIEPTVSEYDVKTQGKNYNSFALPKCVKLPF